MLLTVNEVATLLRLDPQTIYRMVRQNSIPYLKVGSNIRFDKEAINKWMINQTMASSARKGV